MTEEEARTKWCPMVRFGNEAGCNRNANPPGSSTPVDCIASGCMCWVWDLEKDYTTVSGAIMKASGHCGLING